MKNFFTWQWNNHKQRLMLIITAVLFLVTAVLYAFGFTSIFNLTPLFLGLITAVALLFWQISPRKKAILLVTVIIGTYILELIGVHTGYIFGDYTYGSIMGFRVWGVPITIGITWFLVTLSAWHIVSFGGVSLVRRIFLGSILILMFDLVLEQFAILYGLWSWQGARVPLSNYVAWFIIGSVILFLYNQIDTKRYPSLYIAGLLPIMALFFWIMLLVR